MTLRRALRFETVLCVALMLLAPSAGAPAAPLQPAPAGSGRGTEDWPQFQCDASRAGTTSSQPPRVNTTLWSLQTGGAVESSPAVWGDALFAGSGDGRLYALNRSTGALLWSAQTGGPIRSSPAVAGGCVYVGSDDGGLHAFNLSTGSEKFNWSAGSPIRAPILALTDRLVFGTEGGNLTALNFDGGHLWTQPTGASIVASQASDGVRVFVVSGDTLRAFLFSNGNIAWPIAFSVGHNLSPPSVAAGRLYVGAANGSLYALNPQNANVIWSAQLDGPVVSSPAFSSGSLFIGTANGSLYRVNAATGAEEWRQPLGAGVERSVALAQDIVIAPTLEGLTARLLNGSEVWSLALPGGPASSPAVSRSRAYVGSSSGLVVAVGWAPTARIAPGAPASTYQGTPLSLIGTAPDCEPVAWEWRSSLDGPLSTRPNLTISTLSLGAHGISLRVQDGNWSWSAPYTISVEVLPSLEWPMFRKDTSHRGASEGEVPLTSTIAWRTAIGGRVYSSPVVWNGTLYVGSRLAPGSPGRLSALDTRTGDLLWSYNSTGMIDSTPACADGMVFVADDAGNLVAFDADPSDGVDEGEVDVGRVQWDVIWSYRNASVRSVQGSPVVAAGRVLVPSRWEPALLCLDEWTGVPLWSFTVPGDTNQSDIWSTPAVEGGLALIGSNNGRLYALDLATGVEVWNFTTRGAILGSPCVFNRTVYFGSSDWKLYALHLSNGTKRWEYTMGDEVTASPAISGGKLMIGSFDTSFRALDAESGQSIWDFQTGGMIHSSAAVGGGMAFFGSYDGMVYALNVSNGKLVWSHNTGAQNLRSSPALSGGRLYIGTETGEVIAFGKAPDLSVSSSSITLSSPVPNVSEEVRITAVVENIGTLDAEADAMVFNGPPEDGALIHSSRISVPAGSSVELSCNWTVEPGYNILVVNVTNTTPHEANRTNNQASRLYVPPPQAGWTMFKSDPGRTSSRPELQSPNSGELDWSFNAPGEVRCSPVTAGARVYLPAGDTLYALDSRSRALVWRREVGATITTTPAVSNLIVLGTAAGDIIALNERGGGVAWTLRAEGPVNSSPLIAGDTVYIGAGDGCVYSISLPDGRLLWRTQLGGPVESSPALDVAAGRILAGSSGAGGGRLSCLFLNGTIAWSADFPAPLVSTPAIESGVAYVGCDDGRVLALEVAPDEDDDGLPDPQNSTYDTLWSTDLSPLVTGDDARVRSSPALLDGSVFVGAGHSTVAALRASDGTMLWSRSLGSPMAGRYMTSSPALASGRLFIGADGVYALNSRSGATIWVHPTQEWVWASPAVSGGGTGGLRSSVVVATEGGRLLVFSTKVQIPPEAVITSPAREGGFRVGESILFDASGSSDLDGEVVELVWDFGDGASASGWTAFHNYTEPGNYTVVLSVKDDQDLENSTSTTVRIRTNLAPGLRLPLVSPGEGDVRTLFQMRVTYFDEDNDSATFVRFVAGDQLIPLLPLDPEDINSTDGREYYCETTLLSGIYAPYFETSDGVLLNTTPSLANLTVTNQSVFRFSDPIEVEMLYAGRGEVRYNYSLIEHEVPAGMVKVFPQLGKFELSVANMDRWWWANITFNFSTVALSGVNRSTLRIYRFTPEAAPQWRLAEGAGLDLSRNITFANVTELSIFSVLALPPPNSRPNAVLSRKEITITEGETVTFNASGSSDPDGDPLTFLWDFGDSPERKMVQGDRIAEHKYTKPGRYYVTVTVSDGKDTDNETATVIVKQKGGEQTVLLIVILTVLVVAIIFMIPRGKRARPEAAGEEE
ncbi:MAG: outer membrane protein assembly factor BamB family protein [Thermoplasmatota archaeon]